MQEAAAEQPPGLKASWSHLLATSALPVAASSLHSTLASPAHASSQSAVASIKAAGAATGDAAVSVYLSEGDTLVAMETLRLLVVMASSMAAMGQEAQQTVLQVCGIYQSNEGYVRQGMLSVASSGGHLHCYVEKKSGVCSPDPRT